MSDILTKAQQWGVSEQAARLHDTAFVWDGHGGFGYSGPSDLDELDRWHSSGVDFLSLNAAYDVKPWDLTIECLSRYRHWVRDHADTVVQVKTTDDARRAKREDKLAVSFDIEGMNALNGDAGMVDFYYTLGVRQMLFAYNRNNLAGGGCHDDDCGLTDFGRDVIREMNRVGMIVDCSHTGYKTAMQAMEASEAPVIFSHSNARDLWDHERNIPNDLIKAAAETGGFVGVTGVAKFLGPKGAVVEHLVQHIDHMVDLVGPEHVAISMDSVLDKKMDSSPFARNREYWPESQYPEDGIEGYIRPEEFPKVTQALLDRGYEEGHILGILGENYLKLASAIWK
ncbi:MAG: membrane dipeptidase [Rhodospirillaceae bacterium]|nr:membrane dipeptidase [Rhodospirillaceae bacterium]